MNYPMYEKGKLSARDPETDCVNGRSDGKKLPLDMREKLWQILP